MQALIVDDDIATVEVIREKVSWNTLGIRGVFTAYNIQQAKEILRQNDIAIVISDIEMPQGTGIELLEWYRKENMQGEFLLLTCHESFDYATNALKLQAAEYLLKPFDVTVMEAALKRLTIKISEEKKKNEQLEYGKWASSNKRHVQLSFVRLLLEGRIDKAIDMKNDALPKDGKYRLVISRVTDVDRVQGKMNPGLLGSVLENIHSEVLFGNPENNRVVTMEQRDCFVLASICEARKDAELERCAKEVIYQVEQIANVPVSCCISSVIALEEVHTSYNRCLKQLMSHVAYYRSCFFEDSVAVAEDVNESILDISYLTEQMGDKNKAAILECLKKILNDRMFDKTLNDNMLKEIYREVWQAVYTFFGQNDIEGDSFFKDDVAAVLTEKATQSVMDMMRFANYLLEQLFAFTQSVSSELSPIDRMKLFVREHYMENIGRNELADELGLNPEYVSKLFKKESGINLSDYIASYRVEQAKKLLDRGGMTISEVAEATGFDNSTYFSTTFKKYTGTTPNQYRKQSEK